MGKLTNGIASQTTSKAHKAGIIKAEGQMQARVAKTLASVVVQTIIFCVALAGVTVVLVYVTFAALSGEWILDDYFGLVQLAGYPAFVGGLVVFPLYLYVRINVRGEPPIVSTALTILLWTHPLTLWGGIVWVLIFLLSDWSLEALGFGILAASIAVPFAFASSVITFTLYELSKRVRFARNKQAKSPRLVHP